MPVEIRTSRDDTLPEGMVRVSALVAEGYADTVAGYLAEAAEIAVKRDVTEAVIEEQQALIAERVRAALPYVEIETAET